MKKLNTLPTISIVIPTYNSSRTIGACLTAIRGQHYPQDLINIIVVDGGSKDETVRCVKKFRVTFVSVDPQKQNAEYNKSIGLAHATGDVVAFIDHDNILPHKNWFKGMIQPFLEDKTIVGVETLRYCYDPKTSLLDRYFALYGAGDPLVWYLGKADRLSYIYDVYAPSGNVVDCGNYVTVRFTPENMPTIGANGFMVRRKILMKYAKTTPGMYFDMDVNVDLIVNGFNHYAFVKDSILHLTGYDSVLSFLKRRMLFLGQYHRGKRAAEKKVRRYGILSYKGVFDLAISILICLTFIVPFIDACRGYRKIQDKAWFLHPFMCFSFVVIYSWAIIKSYIYTYAKQILER